MKSFYLLAIAFLVFVLCEEPGKVPKYKYILKTSLSLTEVQELLAEKGKVKDYKKKYEKKHNKIEEEEETIENEIENQIVEENSNNNETNTTVLVSKEEKLSAIKEKSEQKVQAIKDKEEIKEAEIEAKEEKEEANSEAKLEKKEKESEKKDEKKKNKKEAKEEKKEAKQKEKEDKKEESLKKDLVELIQINENNTENLKAPEVTMFSYFFGLIIISCFIGLFVYATQYPKFHQKRINIDNNYLIHNSNEYKKDDDYYQNMRDF
jgi:uncharacterized protein YhaN